MVSIAKVARYVFGNELKPGERWKRRLLTTSRRNAAPRFPRLLIPGPARREPSLMRRSVFLILSAPI